MLVNAPSPRPAVAEPTMPMATTGSRCCREQTIGSERTGRELADLTEGIAGAARLRGRHGAPAREEQRNESTAKRSLSEPFCRSGGS
jgi:hypothetical protein